MVKLLLIEHSYRSWFEKLESVSYRLFGHPDAAAFNSNVCVSHLLS